MLALAPGIGYIHEPFSPQTDPGISAAPFHAYFTALTAADDPTHLPHLERTLAFRYAMTRQLAIVRTPSDAARTIRDATYFLRARIQGARPLVKDPIALLSAEWLAERFAMDVVVTIRHPAAFAASVQRLGWNHRFDGFAGNERLGAFAAEIEDFAARPRPPLEQAVLLWRIFYTVVDGYRARHPQWSFIRHEDASRDPVATFESLYARLGLELTEDARREIMRRSARGNPVEARSKHAIDVDSAANVERWRSRLSADEIALVRDGTADVWPRFYDEADW